MSESPRREERFLLPAVTIWIPATFRMRDQEHHGRLWDVSYAGCCLLFPPGVGIHPGQSGELVISHPSSNQSIDGSILILWVDREAGGTYAGGRFTRKIDFSRTFLNTLMNTKNQERPPGGRLV